MLGLLDFGSQHESWVFAQEQSRPQVAQLLYPPASGPKSIMVIGHGNASMPADSAEVRFFLMTGYSEPDFGDDAFQANVLHLQAASRQSCSGSTQREAANLGRSVQTFPSQFCSKLTQIEETDFDGFVQALVDVGVPRASIEVKLTPTSDGAVVSLNLLEPTQEQLQAIVNAGKAAVEDEQFFLDDIWVNYSLKDCQPLELLAYERAIRDAATRAMTIAQSLQANLSEPPSIAESPLNLFAPTCNEQFNPLSLFWGNSNYGGQPAQMDETPEVSLQRHLFVTYTLE
jgi:hypothetical protein